MLATLDWDGVQGRSMLHTDRGRLGSRDLESAADGECGRTRLDEWNPRVPSEIGIGFMLVF